MNNQTLVPRMTLWARKNRKRYNTRARCYNAKRKLIVLRHYSDVIPRCKGCGICDVRFLVLDHIHGNGQEDRRLHGKGSTFYNWLISVGFPEGFQVLCYHCNLKKNRIDNYE